MSLGDDAQKTVCPSYLTSSMHLIPNNLHGLGFMCFSNYRSAHQSEKMRAMKDMMTYE